MDDLINEFLIESTENLDRLDSELVKLESDPSSQELLSSIFRTIHTIKGSCGFLGFSKLEKVAHGGESLLSLLRDGKLSLTAEITSGLLSMVDAIRTILSEIKNTGMDGAENYPELIETLIRLQQPAPASGTREVSGKPHTAKKSQGIKQEKSEPTPVSGQLTSKITSDTKQVVPVASGEHQPDAVQLPAEDIPLGLQQQEGTTLQSSAGPGFISPALPEDAQSTLQTQDESRSRGAQADTIRVDVHLLDRLMNLVGELVLTRNQIAQFSARQTDAAFVISTQQLNLLTSELQEEVMKTRMQPISNVFDKFPRVVRDVAMSCGKQVLIEMEGKQTEIDKSLLEAIKDPLTHIVRNSVDHGIEMPDLRVSRGKRPEGHIKLRACHEGGQVLIEISDDGAGIDIGRVKRKALDRGPDHGPASCAHERARASQSGFSSGVLHGRKSHKSFRAWRGHGRRKNEHRPGEWLGGPSESCGKRHGFKNQDSADAGHRAGRHG